MAKSTALKVILLLMLSVAIANGIQSTMVSICHPRKGSIGEAFSLPLQQTARVVAEHSSEISNEEKMAIDAVVDYDHLAELYNPIIADPVKATWKPYATKDDIIRYIKTWFRMFLKYPTTYILATFNQNFYIITPFIENDVVIYTVEDKEIAERVHEKYPIRLGFLNDELNEIVINGQKLLFSLPIVGVLFNAAFCNIIMLLTIIIAVMHTKKKYLIAVLPVFLSFVVIILAPVFLYHPRYAFPIIYSMPVLLAFLNSENET